MTIRSLCGRKLVSVHPHVPLSDVASLMRESHVGAVVVIAGEGAAERVVGIITDRDIVRAQLAKTADLSRISAADAMTREPLVLSESASIQSAIADLRARRVRRAPVVSAQGRPIGLVSVDDLLAHLAATLSSVATLIARQVHSEA